LSQLIFFLVVGRSVNEVEDQKEDAHPERV